MADTGSEPKPKRRRLTLRLRLTLLYGVCFLIGGAAVLGITYVLVAHDTSSQAQSLSFQGPVVHVTRHGTASAIGTTPAASGTGGGAAGAGPVKTITTAISTSGRANAKVTSSASAGGRPHKVIVSGGVSTLLPATVVAKDGKLTPAQRAKLRRLRAAVRAKIQGVAESANVALQLQRHQSMSALLTWSGSALGALAVISILLGWFLAGRALKPLATMTVKAQQITEENLHERLSTNVREDELGQLANTFDGLLARLEHAFEAQKRFVANASHELRTPLTLERTLAEVALADPAATVESLRRVCERVVASTAQQEQLIEALLWLARSQNAIEANDDADLARIAEAALRQRGEQLGAITVTADLRPAETQGNVALLERLVANLLDNAIGYNGGAAPWIKLETGVEAASDPETGPETDVRGAAWIRVSNSGDVIASEVIDSLFEPFRRLQPDRTSNDGGFGLGLSIVQSIVGAHHAALTATPVPDGGLSVEVRFAEPEGNRTQ